MLKKAVISGFSSVMLFDDTQRDNVKKGITTSPTTPSISTPTGNRVATYAY